MNNPRKTKSKATKPIVVSVRPANNNNKRRRQRTSRSNTTLVPYSNTTNNGYAYSNMQAPNYSSKSMTHNKDKLTPMGINFLKCAFAPPDFANSNVGGVPDNFQGKSLIKKHRSNSPWTFPTANQDVYFLLAPVPGVAFYYTAVAAGTPILSSTTFQAVQYSDFGSFFALGPSAYSSVTNNVVAYRFISNHFELVPTVNAMQWSGSIQAWKTPIQLEVRPIGATTTDLYTVTGLQGCNSTNSDRYTSGFNMGLFTGAYNTGSNFDFNPIYENISAIPNAIGTGDFSQLAPGIIGNATCGIDNNFDTVVIKISGTGTNILNSCLIKTWACVEYKVNTISSLYEYQTISPHDQLALDMYRQIINNLPVGVSCGDNANFWTRVLQIIRNISGALSSMPGPYGMVAAGVNGIATGIENLTM